jgi:hypothetical protein
VLAIVLIFIYKSLPEKSDDPNVLTRQLLMGAIAQQLHNPTQEDVAKHVATEYLKKQSNLDLNSKVLKPYLEDRRIFGSKGERIMTYALENITGKKFVKANTKNKMPDDVELEWLRNPETGRMLELDAFNQEMGLAAEYQGIQHYEYPNKYHKDVKQFESQRQRDETKRKLCDKNSIYLITVPYTVKHDDIEEYVKEKIKPLIEFLNQQKKDS